MYFSNPCFRVSLNFSKSNSFASSSVNVSLFFVLRFLQVFVVFVLVLCLFFFNSLSFSSIFLIKSCHFCASLIAASCLLDNKSLIICFKNSFTLPAVFFVPVLPHPSLPLLQEFRLIHLLSVQCCFQFLQSLLTPLQKTSFQSSHHQ